MTVGGDPIDAPRGDTAPSFRESLLTAFGDLAFRVTDRTAGAAVHGAEHLEAARRHPRGVIYAGWHGRLLVGAQALKNRGVAVMVSLNRDGERIARLVARHGFVPVRGSTSRGGREALREMAALAGRGVREMAFTPDGPRGPRHAAQAGVVRLAARTGFVILPVGVSAHPGRFLGSWDRFLLPLPWARVVLVYRAPLDVPADPDEDTVEALRRRVEEEMKAAEDAADRAAGWAS